MNSNYEKIIRLAEEAVSRENELRRQTNRAPYGGSYDLKFPLNGDGLDDAIIALKYIAGRTTAEIDAIPSA